MVGQTPKSQPLGAGGQAPEKEEREWHLVYESGMAPRCLMYEYVSKGRHYMLTLCIYYDERGHPQPFGSMRLLVTPPGKTYEFGTYESLKAYLERKGVPLSGIEITRLWDNE
jgi:hypothetical protein